MSNIIRKDEMLRYLGYSGQQMTAELEERIERGMETCERTIHPKCYHQVFDTVAVKSVDAKAKAAADASAGAHADTGPNADASTGAHADAGPNADASSGGPTELCIVGTPLIFAGHDITTHLDGAVKCALMVCTLGMESERQLQRLSKTNPLDALIFGAACTDLVEQAANAEEAAIVAEATSLDLYTSSRFSPGYGDFSLAIQPAFLDVLRAHERLGITLTKDFLMIPTKSTTAVVGMYETVPTARRAGCGQCECAGSCMFRRAGTRCYEVVANGGERRTRIESENR